MLFFPARRAFYVCFRPKFEPQIRLPEPFFFLQIRTEKSFSLFEKKVPLLSRRIFQLGINSNEKIEKALSEEK